jgi:hypothetical protein
MGLKIHGVYDIQTIKRLKSLGINSFAFDFRPTSFNFIPQHICLELIEDWIHESDQISLFFDQDSPIVIKEIYENIRQTYFKRFQEAPLNKLQLNFSYAYDLQFLAELAVPFKCYFYGHEQFSAMLSSPYFKGVILQYPDLKDLFQQNKLELFQQQLQELEKKAHRKIDYEVMMDWNIEVLPEIEAMYKNAEWTLPIGQDIELDYRKVDLNRMDEKLKNLKFLSN